jgi:NAD kinase
MLTGPDEMEGAIERVMTGGFSVTSRMRLSCRLNARDQPYDGKGSPLPPPPECVAFVVVLHHRNKDSPMNYLFVRPVFQVMNEVAVQGNFVRLTTIDCFVDNHHLGRSTVRAPLSSSIYLYIYLLFYY